MDEIFFGTHTRLGVNMIGRAVSHYKIIEKIGEGGMGTVYKAEDTRLDRFVALKFLSPRFLTDDTARARFVREAKAASALEHNNITTVHEIDEISDGRMFIVMANNEGRSLKQVIGSGQMPVEMAVDVAVQIASGLGQAHEKGIMHRDVKAIGKRLNANMVVWGEVFTLYGEVEIQPYLTTQQNFDWLADTSADPLETRVSEPNQLQLRRIKAEEVGNIALMLAGGFYQKRDPDKALMFLNRVEPFSSESLRRSGKVYDFKGEYDKARLLYRQTLKIDPENIFVYINLAISCHREGDSDKAIEVCREAIGLHPDEAVLHANLGYVCRFSGRYDEAETAYRKAIEIDPGEVESHEGLGYILCFHQGQGEEGVKLLRRAAELEPDFTWSYTTLGAYYEREGRYEEAIAEYKKAVEIDPWDSGTYRAMAYAYVLQNNCDTAVELCEKAIAEDPEFAPHYTNLGFISCKCGEFDDGASAYRRAVALDSTQAEPYDGLGWLLSRDQKNHDQALDMFRKAIERDPDFTWSHNNMGAVYFKQGRFDEAVQAYTRAIESNPDWTPAYFYLGRALQIMGDFKQAAANFKIALDRKDGSPILPLFYFLNERL